MNTSPTWIYNNYFDDLLANGYYVIILKEIEPSQESIEFERKKMNELLSQEIWWQSIKENFPEYETPDEFIDDYLKEWKYKIKYYLKSKRLVCTCRGFKSAKRAGRMCHHLFEYLQKHEQLEDSFARRICPKKWFSRYFGNISANK